MIDEYTNAEYATSIRNMITEEKLAATSKEIILVVEYEKGKIKSITKGYLQTQ